jgi:hypothetical protein
MLVPFLCSAATSSILGGENAFDLPFDLATSKQTSLNHHPAHDLLGLSGYNPPFVDCIFLAIIIRVKSGSRYRIQRN